MYRGLYKKNILATQVDIYYGLWQLYGALYSALYRMLYGTPYKVLYKKFSAARAAEFPSAKLAV